jgi:2-hydroxychromene-2-carboxylate isomerase
MPTLEFFYDCSSPWTYLAFKGVQPIAGELGVEIDWRPILVGGVFNAVNQELYAMREKAFEDATRVARMMKDLNDWGDYQGIDFRWPGFHLKVNSVRMMRACLVAQEQGMVVPYSEYLFAAYWEREEDVSGEEALSAVAEGLGLDRVAFADRLASDDIKERLRVNTQELIDRGGYGSPTLFINGDDMYFGNDRLPLVEFRLRQLLSNGVEA